MTWLRVGFLLMLLLLGAFGGGFYSYVTTWAELSTEGSRLALVEALAIQAMHELRP